MVHWAWHACLFAQSFRSTPHGLMILVCRPQLITQLSCHLLCLACKQLEHHIRGNRMPMAYAQHDRFTP